MLYFPYPLECCVYKLIDGFDSFQSLSSLLKANFNSNELTFSSVPFEVYQTEFSAYKPEKVSRQRWVYQENKYILSNPKNIKEIENRHIILGNRLTNT